MKKIIAREFLMLTLLIVLSVLFYLIYYPYKSYYNGEIDNNHNELINIEKSVEKLDYYQSIQKGELESLDFRLSRLAESLDFRFSKSEESLDFRLSMLVKGKKKYDFSDLDFSGLEPIPNKLSIKDRFKIRKLRMKLYELSNNKNRKLVLKDQIDSSLFFLILLSIPLFLLRYFYYAFRWSLKIMKEK